MAYTFAQLVATCKKVAEAQEVDFEVKDYSQHGWMGISLLVDHFGGCAVHLCYLQKSGRCYDWIHSRHEVEITSLEQLEEHATAQVVKTRRERSGSDLADFINDQY